jgi:hypothetical protein
MMSILERKKARALLSIMMAIQIVLLVSFVKNKWRSNDLRGERDTGDWSYNVRFESSDSSWDNKRYETTNKRNLRPKANKASKAANMLLVNSLPIAKSSKKMPSEEVSEVITATLTDLTMSLSGINALPDSSQAAFETLLADHSKNSIDSGLAGSVSKFQTSIEVTGLGQQSRMLQVAKRDRFLQDAVVVTYTQTVQYVSSDSSITPMMLATFPLESSADQQDFVGILESSSDPVLQTINGVSDVTVSTTPSPTTSVVTPAPTAPTAGTPTASPSTSPIASPDSPASAPSRGPTVTIVTPAPATMAPNGATPAPTTGSASGTPTASPSDSQIASVAPTGPPTVDTLAPVPFVTTAPTIAPASKIPSSSPSDSSITDTPSSFPLTSPTSLPGTVTAFPTEGTCSVIEEDYSKCAITATFECKINTSNLPCNEVTADSCAIGMPLTVVWKVYNPECNQDISTTCTGFPGCFDGTESYPGCYSNEVYATYDIIECLNAGEIEKLTFTAVAGDPAADSCSFSKTYCNVFRISDQPIASTLTNDDTCANVGDGC